MSLHQLRRDQEARAELQRLRQMFDQGEYTHEEQCLCEAEQLLRNQRQRGPSRVGFIESGEGAEETAQKSSKGFESLFAAMILTATFRVSQMLWQGHIAFVLAARKVKANTGRQSLIMNHPYEVIGI